MCVSSCVNLSSVCSFNLLSTSQCQLVCVHTHTKVYMCAQVLIFMPSESDVIPLVALSASPSLLKGNRQQFERKFFFCLIHK